MRNGKIVGTVAVGSSTVDGIDHDYDTAPGDLVTSEYCLPAALSYCSVLFLLQTVCLGMCVDHFRWSGRHCIQFQRVRQLEEGIRKRSWVRNFLHCIVELVVGHLKYCHLICSVIRSLAVCVYVCTICHQLIFMHTECHE